MAAAVLLVGKLEQSPIAHTFPRSALVCRSVALSTETQPASSEIGEPFKASSGPMGGETCRSV